MITEKTCPWCNRLFEVLHGNNGYCSSDCQIEAKKERQKQRRDPVKGLFPILMQNHEILDRLYKYGKMELTREEIEAYKIDLSLCRYIKSFAGHEEKITLDFGTYYIITEIDFLTFQIFKHETDEDPI